MVPVHETSYPGVPFEAVINTEPTPPLHKIADGVAENVSDGGGISVLIIESEQPF
jgi:hypothetical protein